VYLNCTKALDIDLDWVAQCLIPASLQVFPSDTFFLSLCRIKASS
jgi:hypothetical protein